MINIVACASDNYTMQCGVLFYSVCKNNFDEVIRFFVFIDKQFTEEHKNEIRNTISAFPHKSVSFVQVTDEQVDNFLQFESKYYPRHVFFRLLMANLLPVDLKKALYLDCDIIVRHSLSKLWSIDISNYAIGCVRDALEGKIKPFDRLGYDYENGYFNSGVLLVNLEYWRENDLTKKYANFISNNPEKIVLPDQDVLNAVLNDKKFFISFTYNFQSGFLLKDDFMSDYRSVEDKESICASADDPIILHFSGARPWIEGCDHPYKEEFFKYQNKTIWKDEPLWKEQKPFKTKIINFLRPLGAKLGLCHLIPDYYDRSYVLKGHK